MAERGFHFLYFIIFSLATEGKHYKNLKKKTKPDCHKTFSQEILAPKCGNVDRQTDLNIKSKCELDLNGIIVMNENFKHFFKSLKV